ncbi:MAG: helix-turn-helix transcriptional regulator [Thiolinea sp.]
MTSASRDAVEAGIRAREALFEDIAAGRLALPEAVRRMRKIVGMTQPEYARLVGIAPRVLMDIERGKANPRLDTLEKLAKPFGLQIGFIMNIT